MATTNEQQKTPMTYVRLGKSGLKVSRIILGCMSYGSPEWDDWVLGEEESIKHIKAAYDAGINTFDTANVYSNGMSEVVLGKAIKEHNLPRDGIVVMTKLWFATPKTPAEKFVFGDPDTLGYANRHGLSRKHIFESIKLSLERLQLDYVDVLQCHRFDPDTPIAETMHALHDIVKAGYVRYVGMSSCWAWQFHAMQNYAINNNLTPFISMQNHYNLIYREEEREMYPTLKLLGVGSIPWSPLARGLLSRPFDAQKDSTRSKTDVFISIYTNKGMEPVINAVEKIAKNRNARVTAPIIGTTSLKNLYDSLGAINIELTKDEIKELEAGYVAQEAAGHN
ncbi:hypothetical protein D9619_010762 [Psilocybe cf. subviscida]|uniref:NADP-dependent oxidoreductase domain-containing protein n=1 Tax=Psilocybe cf. subviscida TaxID=2480587 RepID=A0A8H5F0B4_9AGAR|nr:hypothetical protein D9619_010762 [Psilocybe cf. subviscida]